MTVIGVDTLSQGAYHLHKNDRNHFTANVTAGEILRRSVWRGTVPKIRHLAIVALDSERVADFYKAAFDMEEAFRHPSSHPEGRPAIYLSDGYMNLAILPVIDRPEGINHIGFQVDDVESAHDTAIAAGAVPPTKVLPRDGRQAETFVLDPLGIKLDLSRGWAVTTPAEKEPSGAVSR
jgi:catechol 2,3-dioxygenase-like lactoylglutathione lyase family enzyme